MLKRVLLSLVTWQLSLTAAVLVSVIFGSDVDRSVLVPCVAAGFVVAPAVTLFVRRIKRGHAALVGFGVGLLPTIAGITYGLCFAHQSVDIATGWLALSLWLAIPSAAGGALSGFFSSPQPVHKHNA